MPTDELRGALLGYGLAGRYFHAAVIGAVPGLRVTAVVTSSPERGAQARADLPGVDVVPGADEIWAAAGSYDFVVVATPNRAHAQLASAAINAGLPTVVDKPLAVTSAEAGPLVERARERGVLLTAFQNRRWDAELLTLRRLLAEGALGTVHRFESRFERWRPELKAGWRESGDPAEGGGVLLDLGSHLVDQAMHLFGPVDSVYGEVDVRRPLARADDDAFVALRHASGVLSHLWVSAVAADVGPRLRVLGSRAAFVAPNLDPQEDMLRADLAPPADSWGVVPETSWGVVGAGGDVRPVPSERGNWRAFYEQWRDALRGQGDVPVDPADAVATLRVLEAAVESAGTHSVISLA